MAVTSWTLPGSASTGTPSGGTLTWSNPGNILANDNTDATNTISDGGMSFNSGTSVVLRASNFGFSIPSGSQIDGIEVRYERYQVDSSVSANIDVTESTENLIGPSSTFVGNNKSGSASWETSRTLTTLGGSSDTWGWSPSASDINDSDFGFGIQATLKTVFGETAAAHVDYVQIRIYYTAPPSDPTGISVSQVNDNIEITWTDNATDEDNYEIQRNIDSAGWVSLSSSLAADTESYTDTPPLNDSSIQYRVRATKTGGVNSSFDTASAFNYTPHTGRGSPITYY